MMTRMKKTAAILADHSSAGLALAGIVHAQQKTMSIGTGGTGGVYYPLGGAVANVLSKNLPNVQATAEVTGGSIDNLKLIASGQSEMASPWPTPRSMPCRARTSSRAARCRCRRCWWSIRTACMW